jgi:hypothetical protein
MWSIWRMLLKFGVKRAPKSCQNLGQKMESKLDENWVKLLKSGQGRFDRILGRTIRRVPPGLAPVRGSFPACRPVWLRLVMAAACAEIGDCSMRELGWRLGIELELGVARD